MTAPLAQEMANNELPVGTGEPFDPAQLLFRLATLANGVARAVGRAYARPFRLSPSQWQVMAVLARHGTIGLKDVIERTGLDKKIVSSSVIRLHERGFILQEIDHTDHRRLFVGLTDAGQAVHRKVVPKVRSVERRLLSELDRKERALIIRIIRELENRLATV
jgi:DNA-binding MarR family transcriptional regulator